MRIKVNPKEKSLTDNKMERGEGGSGRKSYAKGAQLCTFMTAIMAFGSDPSLSSDGFHPGR